MPPNHGKSNKSVNHGKKRSTSFNSPSLLNITNTYSANRHHTSKRPSTTASTVHDTETTQSDDHAQATGSYAEGASEDHLSTLSSSGEKDANMQSSSSFHPYQAHQYNASTNSPLASQHVVGSTNVAPTSGQQEYCRQNTQQADPVDNQRSGTYPPINEDPIMYQQEYTQSHMWIDNTTSSVNETHAHCEEEEYQLQQWADETSHPNLNIGEILYEKSNWGNPKDEYEYQNRNLAVTEQFDGPAWDLVGRRERL